jgi:hypothetical protein
MKLKIAIVMIAFAVGILVAVAVAAFVHSDGGTGREYCPGPPRPCVVHT